MNSHNKHFKTIFFPRLYLVLNLLKNFNTFFTSDDLRLYQIAILQASIIICLS